MLGYALHPDPDREHAWRSALHLKMVYTGLFPVFEANVDLGDRVSRQYYVRQLSDGARLSYQVAGIPQTAPQISAWFRTYVPLSFARGGRLFGITPQLSYSIGNNPFALEPVDYTVPMRLQGLPAYYRLASPSINLEGPVTQRLSASVRAYFMAPRAESQTYPRWGIGVETGVGLRPGLDKYYAPSIYAYAYGYLPGVTRAQGLKWTAMAQTWTKSCVIGEMYANTLPRGFDEEDRAFASLYFPRQWRVTADYAIPIYVGDLSIPGVAYIKNFLLTPHADYTDFSGGYDLWSAGADLSASLARLFVLPFDASIGISVSYLGGTLYPFLQREKPWSVSMIFGVDF